MSVSNAAVLGPVDFRIARITGFAEDIGDNINILKPGSVGVTENYVTALAMTHGKPAGIILRTAQRGGGGIPGRRVNS